MTPRETSEDAARRMGINPEFIRLYEEAEFDGQYKQMVWEALRCIDEARRALIDAQNELVDMLDHSNDHTRNAFAQFYCDGGVDAHDWSSWSPSDDYKRRRRGGPGGQLRLVRSP